MARKERNLANFADVASNDNENDVVENNKNNNDINNDNNNDNKIKNNDDIMHENKDSVNKNNKNNNILENNNKNNNSILNNNKNDNEDIFDKLLDGKKKKQPKNVWTGVYLKPEIADVLEQLAKKGGKGVKSEVVNEALRRVFVEKGLMGNSNQL